MNLTFKIEVTYSANSPTQLLVMFVLPATLETAASVLLLLPTALLLSLTLLNSGLAHVTRYVIQQNKTIISLCGWMLQQRSLTKLSFDLEEELPGGESTVERC